MLIGVNWTYPHTLPEIQKLIDYQLIDFCEIAVDNFVHLPAAEISRALRDIPIALHILKSRFLEKTPAELQTMAHHLYSWIKALKPIYVSDHLARFTNSSHRHYPLAMELEYEKYFAEIKEQIRRWQMFLEEKIYFENFASHLSLGKNQPLIFEKLLQDTNAGLLFDFSNAMIAEINKVCEFDHWQPLLQNTQHFHVAGFRMLESPQIAMDTHDVPVAEAVLQKIIKKPQSSIVIEYDAHMNFDIWQQEIQRLKARQANGR